MRKRTTKIIALVLTMMFLVTIVGCGNNNNQGGQTDNAGTDDKVITLHVAATVAPEHSYTRAAVQWAEEIEEKTGGKIKPLIEFGGVHGGERETVEATIRGDLDMVWAADMAIAAVIPELGFTNLPYLFKDYDEVDQIYRKGWIGEYFAQVCEEKGLVVLGVGENEFRGLTNSKHPIKSGEDLKGLKIRTPETPMFLAFFKALGTLPTPMAITELATGLQQKAVDGQDNGPNITYSFGLDAFNKYVTKTQHMYSAMHVIMNKDLFYSLTPEQQQIMREVTEKYCDVQTQYCREDVAKFYEEMAKRSGCEIIDRTPELEAALKEAAKVTWNNEEVMKAYNPEVVKKLKEMTGF